MSPSAVPASSKANLFAGACLRPVGDRVALPSDRLDGQQLALVQDPLAAVHPVATPHSKALEDRHLDLQPTVWRRPLHRSSRKAIPGTAQSANKPTQRYTESSVTNHLGATPASDAHNRLPLAVAHEAAGKAS